MVVAGAGSAPAQTPGDAGPAGRAMDMMSTDPTEGRRRLEALAKAGDAEAMDNLAAVLGADGPDWKADPERARGLREAAVKAGSRAAAVNIALGILRTENGNHARAIELLKFAETDDRVRPVTSYGWGRAYLFGWGVERDMKRGVAYLEAFASGYQSNDAFKVEAEFLIGRAYQNGWDVAVDFARAYRHMRTAAELGDQRAQWHTGMMLLEGRGVAANEQEAYRFVKRSAEAGYEDGMISHAVMLAVGQGVTENTIEARSWYRKAAEGGSAHALRGFGTMLLIGQGGPPDAPVGFALLELAATAGDTNAIELLKMFVRQAPPPDRAAIDAEKAKWLAAHQPPRPVK
jgi:TPR repeat protein